jgi:L-amino acid N-acyltransferase YncA
MTFTLRDQGLENIRIRPATLSDAAVIFEIHVDAVTNLCAAHYTADQIGRWFDGRSSQNYLSAIEHQALWIAERAGDALGYTEFFADEVTSLFIRSAMSGRGLGSLLLNFAIERISKGHQGPIRLEATMNGQQFYRKHGFVKVGEGCLIRPSGLRLETVLMERQNA